MEVDLVKLQTIVDRIDEVPRHLFVGHVLPLHNEYNYEDYSWNQAFVGITDKKELVYIFDSGCSCNGPEWEAPEIPDLKECTDRTVKGFEIEMPSVNYYESLNGIDKTVEKVYSMLMAKAK